MSEPWPHAASEQHTASNRGSSPGDAVPTSCVVGEGVVSADLLGSAASGLAGLEAAGGAGEGGSPASRHVASSAPLAALASAATAGHTLASASLSGAAANRPLPRCFSHNGEEGLSAAAGPHAAAVPPARRSAHLCSPSKRFAMSVIGVPDGSGSLSGAADASALALLCEPETGACVGSPLDDLHMTGAAAAGGKLPGVPGAPVAALATPPPAPHGSGPHPSASPVTPAATPSAAPDSSLAGACGTATGAAAGGPGGSAAGSGAGLTETAYRAAKLLANHRSASMNSGSSFFRCGAIAVMINAGVVGVTWMAGGS
jgi:hypothetical protein